MTDRLTDSARASRRVDSPRSPAASWSIRPPSASPLTVTAALALAAEHRDEVA